MNYKTTFSIFICFIFSTVSAQFGNLDNEYGQFQSGITYMFMGETDDIGRAMAYSSSATVVAGSSFSNGNWDFAVIQYLSNMDYNYGFANQGKLVIDFAGGDDHATAVVTSSGTYVGGYAEGASGTTFAVAKLGQFGLTTTYGTEGKVTVSFGSSDDKAYAMVAQPDGKLILGGYATIGGQKDFAICRLNTNGTLDTTFGNGGKVITDFNGAEDAISAMILLQSGKILVAGTSTLSGNSDFAAAQYNANGTLDASFNSTGKAVVAVGSGNDFAHALIAEVTGKIYLAGSTNNNGNLDFALIRLNATGVLDTGFGTSGKVITSFGAGDDEVKSLTMVGNTLFAAGYTFNGTNKDVAIAKYGASSNPYDGVPYPGFGVDGKITRNLGPGDDVATGIVRESDGYLRLAGYSFNGQENDFLVTEFTINGAHNELFGQHGIKRDDFGFGESQARTMVKQNNNKVILAGNINKGNLGINHFALARFNTDGTLDTNFGDNGKVVNLVTTDYNILSAVQIQTDNKIVVGGYKGDINELAMDYILGRYNADGSIDNSFGTNGFVITDNPGHHVINSLICLPNGKILVLAQTFLSGNNLVPVIFRYNANGTLDTTFGNNGKIIQTSLINPSQSFVAQSDGKIILAASSNTIVGVTRFNADGSLDTSFGTSGFTSTSFTGGTPKVAFVQLQPDGKILVSGRIAGHLMIGRYNSDGSKDTAYGNNGYWISQGNAYPITMGGKAVLQPDGKTVLTGSSNGTVILKRIDENGVYTGESAELSGILGDFSYSAGAYLANNRLIIAGYSSHLNDDDSFTILGITTGLPLSAEDFTSDAKTANIIAYPNPVENEVNLSFNFENFQINSVDLYDITGNKITTFSKDLELNNQNTLRLVLPGDLANGTYILSVKSSKGIANIKIVK